jgi:hypothetical protein
MAATIIGAIDEDAAHALGAHVCEGDFLRAIGGGQAPMMLPIATERKPLGIGLHRAAQHYRREAPKNLTTT